MFDLIFQSVINTTITPKSFMLCIISALILGSFISLAYMYKNHYTQSFVITLALLPAIVQLIILLVNGSIGTGVAIAGTFSLVRFRSAPGSAREILSIFLAMAVGLSCGMGYIGLAAIFSIIITAMNLFYVTIHFGETNRSLKQLKIMIPESLDYSELFTDLFEKYTTKAELTKVKTTNMGSLYQLTYLIVLKNQALEKSLIDDLRCRNGNLEITCGRLEESKESL